MSAVVYAASSDGQQVLSATAFYVLVAVVIALTIVLVLALAVVDGASRSAQDLPDTGLALLDAG